MNTLSPEEKLKLFFYQTLELWRKLCELHNELYKLTCEEYHFLLSGDIAKIESIIEEKKLLIQDIRLADTFRNEIITNINLDLDEEHQIKSARDLIKFLSYPPNNGEAILLEKANSLLIEIIEGIQKQNKKNQLFINRTILSLKDIRQVAMGRKQYENYNSQGASSKTVK